MHVTKYKLMNKINKKIRNVVSVIQAGGILVIHYGMLNGRVAEKIGKWKVVVKHCIKVY